MGFTDRALNATLLARHNNDVAKVIAELLEHWRPPRPPPHLLSSLSSSFSFHSQLHLFLPSLFPFFSWFDSWRRKPLFPTMRLCLSVVCLLIFSLFWSRLGALSLALQSKAGFSSFQVVAVSTNSCSLGLSLTSPFLSFCIEVVGVFLSGRPPTGYAPTSYSKSKIGTSYRPHSDLKLIVEPSSPPQQNVIPPSPTPPPSNTVEYKAT